MSQFYHNIYKNYINYKLTQAKCKKLICLRHQQHFLAACDCSPPAKGSLESMTTTPRELLLFPAAALVGEALWVAFADSSIPSKSPKINQNCKN